MQPISLYGFAEQQKTITFGRQRLSYLTSNLVQNLISTLLTSKTNMKVLKSG